MKIVIILRLIEIFLIRTNNKKVFIIHTKPNLKILIISENINLNQQLNSLMKTHLWFPFKNLNQRNNLMKTHQGINITKE